MSSFHKECLLKSLKTIPKGIPRRLPVAISGVIPRSVVGGIPIEMSEKITVRISNEIPGQIYGGIPEFK